jgi:Cft2 family RNA processing exonuclease
MSFSAHADAKGFMQLISWCEPKNVMLVHGEEIKQTCNFKIQSNQYTKGSEGNLNMCIIHQTEKMKLLFIDSDL